MALYKETRMLKPLSVVTVTLFLTACSVFTSPISNSDQQSKKDTLDRSYFVGKWACEMDGMNIGSSNKVQLAQDGYATYDGLLTMPKDNPLLQYKIKRVGTWAFTAVDKTLSYQFTKSSVERDHSYEMLKQIKTNKELNAEENENFKGLTSQMTKANSKPVSLQVSDIAPETFKISQTSGSVIRKGSCTRF